MKATFLASTTFLFMITSILANAAGSAASSAKDGPSTGQQSSVPRQAISDVQQKSVRTPSVGESGGYYAYPSLRDAQQQRNWQNDTRPGGGSDPYRNK